MRKLPTSLALVFLAALTMGARVQPDPGGRDQFLVDTANGDLLVMRAGVVVGKFSSAGLFTPTTSIATTTSLAVGTSLSVATTSVFTGDATFDGAAGAVTLGTGGTIVGENAETLDNATDGEWCLNGAGGTNNEDLCFDLETTANAATLTSNTGVVNLDLAAVGTTVTLANDQTIVSDTNEEIQFGDTEDTSLGFGTANEVTVTTDTGVTRWDFEAIGVRTTVPLFETRVVYFCGNGANATAAVYMPPVQNTIAADMTTYDFGEAGCDGLDSTTETSGDGLLNGNATRAAQIIGMSCGISAAGTDDTYTFTLRDDTADVTGVTCNVTLDGAIQTCQIVLDAPVAVAAGSLWAVKSVASDNDDVSSADVECHVYLAP